MSAARTFAAWKSYARSHSRSGGDNLFTVADVSYTFDARPRALDNGALQGRIYAQPRGQNPADVGGFKIDARGTVVAIPDALRDVLPMAAPAPRAPVVADDSYDDAPLIGASR